MRILYLAHRLPYPPNKGEKIRSFHHLRHLSAAHAVHLVSFVENEDDDAGPLREMCRSVELLPLPRAGALLRAAAAVAGSGSLSAAYLASPGMKRAVQRATTSSDFDVAWASSSALALHLTAARVRRRIVDFVDVDSEKWREFAEHAGVPHAWIYASEAKRLARLEARVAAAADCVLLASDGEAALLRRHLPAAPLRVVPNGVDSDFFRPTERPAADRTTRLVFVGALDYRPNIDAVSFFLRDVLPQLRQRLPGLEFTAVGHRPGAALRRAAEQPGAHIAGSVPDVRPYLADATICVVPLRFGRGVKNKVLEAMAMGLPVVASRVAVDGLAVRDREHLLIADAAVDIAAAIAALASDRERRLSLATNALRYVREWHRWDDVLRGLDEALTCSTRRNG
jgi:sugar transferase (PEP-CTERM/EpsH1 system associated)